MRTRTEPQPKLGVHFAGLQNFHDFIQFGHPAQGQVAIGQEHPLAFSGSSLQQSETLTVNQSFALPNELLGGYWGLALTQA